MKKIAFAIENFSKFAGGAESYLVDLARSFRNEGWEVHVYAEKWQLDGDEFIMHRIRLFQHAPNWLRNLQFALKHRRMVRGNDYDIVYGVGNTLIMDVYQSHGGVHWYSTIRKSFTIGNPFLRYLKKCLIFLSFKNHVRNWIESAAFRPPNAPVVIAISDMIKNDMVRYYGYPEEKIQLVYNGIEQESYSQGVFGEWRENIREKQSINQEEMVLLFVSFELKKKGIFPLIEAAHLLQKNGRKFKILVVGGLPGQGMRRRIDSFGLQEKIIFTGSVKNVAKYYAASDVFVLPTYYDACSLVVLEAMICGLPVITTETNGIAGILNHGKDGFVISHPPEATELYRCVETLLGEKNRRTIGANAYATAAKYTKKANHQAIINLCEQMAGNNRNSNHIQRE